MGPPPWRDKFLTFLGLRKELAARCPEAELFDLRYRDRIIAKQRPTPVADVMPVTDGSEPQAARVVGFIPPGAAQRPRQMSGGEFTSPLRKTRAGGPGGAPQRPPTQ
jgi:hypothetical protein